MYCHKKRCQTILLLLSIQTSHISAYHNKTKSQRKELIWIDGSINLIIIDLNRETSFHSLSFHSVLMYYNSIGILQSSQYLINLLIHLLFSRFILFSFLLVFTLLVLLPFLRLPRIWIYWVYSKSSYIVILV